jgi:hypothetical protein
MAMRTEKNIAPDQTAIHRASSIHSARCPIGAISFDLISRGGK